MNTRKNEQKIGMDVGIVGFGVVGSATANGLHELGHRIHVRDVKPVDELLENGWNFDFKYMPEYDFSQTDVTMLAVPTPVDYDRLGGRIDTRILDSVIKDLGEKFRNHDGYHTFVVRSTVLPGTTRKYGQTLAEISGKQPVRDFGMAMNPEFLRAFRRIEDFREAEMTVMGVLDERTEIVMRNLYHGSRSRPQVMTLEGAELTKYYNNLWNAMKISAWNSMQDVSERLEDKLGTKIDFEAITTVMKTMTEALRNPDYGTHAGSQYGGTCLPKDTISFDSFLKGQGIYGFGMLEETIKENESLRDRAEHGDYPRGLQRRLKEGDTYFQEREHVSYDNYKVLAQVSQNGTHGSRELPVEATSGR